MRRSEHGATAAAVLAGSVAALAGAVATFAEEGLRLERKLWKGQKLQVEEVHENMFDYKVKASGMYGDPTGKTSQTGKSVETKLRSYTQELLEVSGEGVYRIDRVYQKSIKETSKGGSGKKDTVGTDLNGRKVILRGQGPHAGAVFDPEGPIEGDDEDAATFSEKIYGILPSKAVKTGEEWSVPGDVVGPIFFGPAYNPVGFKAAAKGILKDLATQDGRKCARIVLQLELGIQRTEKLPGIHYKIQGMMVFSLEEGTILSLDVSGPLQLELAKDGNSMKVDGTTLLRYRAKILEKGTAPE